MLWYTITAASSVHPHDPTAADVYRIFASTVPSLSEAIPLADNQNHVSGRFGDANFALVCSRSPNIGNLLSPRKLKSPGVQLSELLTAIAPN